MNVIYAKRNVRALFLLCVLWLTACETLTGPKVARPIPLSPAAAEPISIEQLAQLLPPHPVRVGFDVDDTLIFSAPAFNALQPQYDANVIRPKDYNGLNAGQKKQYHDFWTKLNNDYDNRSTPKAIGQKLLDLHTARGDDIYVISKRQSADGNTDACTPRYEKMFNTKFAHPVVQTQLADKTPFIVARKIEYYYGDSDSDIASAATAGAVPIRVQRGAGSYAKDPVHNGQMGEAVLKDSDR